MKTRKRPETLAGMPSTASAASPAPVPQGSTAGLPAALADEVDKPGTVTKRKLVMEITKEIEAEALASDKGLPLTQLQVFSVLQKTLDHIFQSMVDGLKVELRNFGVFECKLRKARVGRNPNAPETDVPIPQRAVVKFKPGKEMRQAVLRITHLVESREQEKKERRARRKPRVRAAAPLAPEAAPPAA